MCSMGSRVDVSVGGSRATSAVWGHGWAGLSAIPGLQVQYGITGGRVSSPWRRVADRKEDRDKRKRSNPLPAAAVLEDPVHELLLLATDLEAGLAADVLQVVDLHPLEVRRVAAGDRGGRVVGSGGGRVVGGGRAVGGGRVDGRRRDGDEVLAPVDDLGDARRALQRYVELLRPSPAVVSVGQPVFHDLHLWRRRGGQGQRRECYDQRTEAHSCSVGEDELNRALGAFAEFIRITCSAPDGFESRRRLGPLH